MTRDEQLAADLRDARAQGRRLFRDAGNGNPCAVDRLDAILAVLGRVADELDPAPRSPRAFAAVEGRFSTGEVAGKGRIIRVETRARRVRRAA